MKKIAIYGKSGHGKVIADIALLNGFESIIWIDDNRELKDCITFNSYIESFSGMPIALGIGNNKIRQTIYQKLEELSIQPLSLIHPSSVISPSAVINSGTVVMANSVINADAYINYGAIINSGAIIEHDNKIGAFVHISPNAALAGNVTVKERTHIGIGANIIQSISIGSDTIVAAGSTVLANVPDNVLVAGSPAKIKKNIYV